MMHWLLVEVVLQSYPDGWVQHEEDKERQQVHVHAPINRKYFHYYTPATMYSRIYEQKAHSLLDTNKYVFMHLWT